ncbi:hypothetical protein BDZ45DRAFT_741905 [Acephala macrosclerotiorum]|nr:hypothetical protein BDZ45DRAFT_741905 [Acephala macrosclerotiorum]
MEAFDPLDSLTASLGTQPITGIVLRTKSGMDLLHPEQEADLCQLETFQMTILAGPLDSLLGIKFSFAILQHPRTAIQAEDQILAHQNSENHILQFNFTIKQIQML